MSNLTSAINSGKSDWKSMQNKKLLKESDVMGGSNTSPNAPIQGGEFTTRDQNIDTTGQNIANLGLTPEYQEYRKSNDMVISNSEKELINQTLKAANLNKDKGVPLSDQLEEAIQEFEIDKQDAINKINENIELFNERTRFALDRMNIGLHASKRELPKIKSLDDFKNIRLTFVSHLVAKLIGQPNLTEAREKLSVPNVVTDQTSNTLERFYTWLQGKPEDLNLLKEYLANVLSGIKSLEVFENIIDGFKKISYFSKLGRKGANASNIKFKGLTPEAEKEVQTNTQSVLSSITSSEPEVVQESIKPRTKSGPGKIFDIYANPEQSTKTSGDIKSAKIQKLKEGWDKYSKVRRENKEKPQGFNIVLG